MLNLANPDEEWFAIDLVGIRGRSGQVSREEDVIARQPRMHVAGVNGFAVNVNALAVADRNKVSKTVFAMKDGDIKTVAVEGAFLTFKVKHAAANGIPPLSQIMAQVTRAAKLEKAAPPEQTIANLYQAAKPQFDSTDYANDFNDIANYKSTSAQ